MADVVHALEWDSLNDQYFLSTDFVRDTVCVHKSELLKNRYCTTSVQEFSDLGHISCSEYWSSEVGRVCIGTTTGTVRLLNVFDSSVLSSLIPKQERVCSALSFTPSGLLAAGYDRARNDESIQLWDIQSNLYDRPFMSYLRGESVSSLKFAFSKPTELLCGTYKSIYIIDTRAASKAHNFATKYCHGICINRNDEHLILSHCESGGLALWDKRYLSANGTNDPVLILPRVYDDTQRRLPKIARFSLQNKREFAVLHDQHTIKLLLTSTTPDMEPVSHLSSKIGPSPKVRPKESFFVHDIVEIQTGQDRVVSFDYALNFHSKQMDFVCIRQNGQLFRMESAKCPLQILLDLDNQLLLLECDEIKKSGPVEINEDSNVQSNSCDMLVSLLDAKNDFAGDDEDEERDEEPEETSESESMLSYLQILSTDISTVMKQRAEAGYSLDTLSNLKILGNSRNSSVLIVAWNWLHMVSKLDSTGVMCTPDLDLGLIGVNSLWNSTELFGNQRRGREASFTAEAFEKCVKTLSDRISSKAFISPEHTQEPRAAFRQVALRLTGWTFEKKDLEGKLLELENKGLHAKAAGWAAFHGDIPRAVQSLAGSRKWQMRLMSTAFAGYLAYKDIPTTNPWRELCRRLASEISQPYLRAIFAYIADRQWMDVLDDGSLPLTERLGIALRFLNDNELSGFLKNLTDRAVKTGDLEGIILTGLTPRLIDLLQSYVDKTADVQTASLIIAFGCPRFFKDDRAVQWIEEYKRLLNSWQFFELRARFDVNWSKLTKTRIGIPVDQPIPKQVFLRCLQCKKIIGGPSNGKTLVTKLSNRCPHCNHPLPLCAICLTPLGATVEGHRKIECWPTFCMSCNHGYHALHARQWFDKYDICPVPTCQCLCNRNDAPQNN